MIPIIDTHQHLWDLDRFRLPWIAAGSSLAHNHLTGDYLRETSGLNVVKTWTPNGAKPAISPTTSRQGTLYQVGVGSALLVKGTAITCAVHAMQVPPKPATIIRDDPLRHRPMQFGPVDPRQPVIDHHQQMHRRRLWRGRLRLFEESAKLHQFPHIGDVLAIRPVEDHCMSVVTHLAHPLVLHLHDAFHHIKHRAHVAPSQVS